ncbi:hypothetical protein D3C73_1571870 [compost metagenome]
MYVFVILVTDHRIKGIYRPVSHRQRSSAQQGEEQRRHDRVDDVFGHGFYRAASHFGRIKLLGIAADDHA